MTIRVNKYFGEVLHFGSFGMRVVGLGTLLNQFVSLDRVHIVQNTSIPMLPITNIQPAVLTNYIDQRGAFEMFTINKDEVFVISRVVIYVKEISSSYPG